MSVRSAPRLQQVLGAAEQVLMYEFGKAAMRGAPYLEEEIASILLTTLIELGVESPVTKRPYTLQSNIDTLTAGFLARCKEQGVTLSFKAGRKLGLQRWMRSNWKTLDCYCKQASRPGCAPCLPTPSPCPRRALRAPQLTY